MNSRLLRMQGGRILGRLLKYLLLCALLAGGGWWYTTQREGSNSAGGDEAGRKGTKWNSQRPQPVSVSPVRTAQLPVWLPAIGSVTPLAQVTVRSRVDGELTRLHFAEGAMVQEGELLAEIDPRSFQVQLRQASGQLTRDSALLDNARLDLKRYQDLWAKDAIAKQQVDAQDALVRQYQGTVETDRGQVENARLLLDYTRITAPVSGRIGLRQVDRGNMVRANDATGLAVITQLQPVAVVFSVPESHVPNLLKRLAGSEPVVTEVWNREQKDRLGVGRLVAMDSVIDATTGAIRLKAELPNGDLALFPNQFVNVRVLMETLDNTLVVPSEAIQQGVKGSHLFVVDGESQVKVVEVITGPADSGVTAIRQGDLKTGDRVVLEGTDKLREGARVEVISPDAPPREPVKKGEWKKKNKGGALPPDKTKNDPPRAPDGAGSS
ncbi:MAG: MdtA/MuxA family multidrug efflux RND transporter periplasmic adaptor subunit [Magnetococcales bacterium]|nr:MdtA/MuxA family multidrug efflux RND transporter periplasmic adaptor subunit [Magnetococcales bacterium]